ncbi:MAG: hypothetical protein MRY57_01930 [Candidatus Pacebacteria bacterium]|nr:hypothetical protein [Candidatus Paceibacterota bacterium]
MKTKKHIVVLINILLSLLSICYLIEISPLVFNYESTQGIDEDTFKTPPSFGVLFVSVLFFILIFIGAILFLLKKKVGLLITKVVLLTSALLLLLKVIVESNRSIEYLSFLEILGVLFLLFLLFFLNQRNMLHDYFRSDNLGYMNNWFLIIFLTAVILMLGLYVYW